MMHGVHRAIDFMYIDIIYDDSWGQMCDWAVKCMRLCSTFRGAVCERDMRMLQDT